MDDEEKLEADQLPPGTTPLWYEVSKGYPKRAILENVSEEIAKISESFKRNLSVTVVYDREKVSDDEEFCQEKSWSYREWEDMMGCEDDCIIALDCLISTSRPHNLLVLITTQQHFVLNSVLDKITSALNSAIEHQNPGYRCTKMSGCPYRGKTLIEKRKPPR